VAKENVENDLEEPEEKPAKAGLKEKIAGIGKKVFKSKKSIIIIAVSLVLFIVICTIAWFFFFKAKPDDEKTKIATEKTIEETVAREQEIIFEDIVELEPFERIALKSGSAMSLVSLKLSLELTDQRYRKQIFTMEGRIREIVTSQMREVTWLELRTPEGKIMLKYNLLKRINSIFPQLLVRNIYFTYLIMQ